MTGVARYALTAVGLLALVPGRAHAQESARTARPICRQSATAKAQTLSLTDGFTVKGAGTRQIGDRTQWVWTGDDCGAWIKSMPAVDTDATGRRLVVAKGGVFDAFQQDAAGVREVTVTGTARHFRLDGREVLPTVVDEQWLGDIALEYTRRAGLHASDRAHAIFVASGLKSVLAEVEDINGSPVRARYLTTVAPLVATEGRAGFVSEAGRLLDHSTGWWLFLDAVPSEWRADQKVLSAIYTVSAAVEPDEIVERILQKFPPPHPASTDIRQLVGILIDTLQTSERRTALRALLLGAQIADRVQ